MASSNSLDEKILENISYAQRLNESSMTPEFKVNMQALFDMGFTNYDVNYNMLTKNLNNIDIVIAKMFD